MWIYMRCVFLLFCCVLFFDILLFYVFTICKEQCCLSGIKSFYYFKLFLFVLKTSMKTRRQFKNYVSEEWIAVQYIEDKVLHMCSLKKAGDFEIGQKCLIPWKDKKKYLAKVLKRGDKHSIEQFLKPYGKTPPKKLLRVSKDLCKKIDTVKTDMSHDTISIGTSSSTLPMPIEIDIDNVVDGYFMSMNTQTSGLVLNSTSSSDLCKKIDTVKTDQSHDTISTGTSSSTLPMHSEIDIDNEIDGYFMSMNTQTSGIVPTSTSSSDLCKKIETVKTDQSHDSISIGTSSSTLPMPSEIEIDNEINGYDVSMCPQASGLVTDTCLKVIQHNEVQININRQTRQSNRYPALRVSNYAPDYSDTIIGKVDDLDIDHLEESFSEESFSEEFYNSPEYMPYSEKKNESDFELTETEDASKSSHSSLNSEISASVTDANEKIKVTFDVVRAKKGLTNSKKLVRDKRVFCLYCETLVSNFPRHLERKHAHEEEVRVFITLPKKSDSRLKHLELLKNKGNLHYNREVLKNKKGCLIVGRRPPDTVNIDAEDYLPCKHCLKFFKKKKLYRHIKNCKFQENTTNEFLPKRRNKLMQSAALLQNSDEDFKQLHEEIFSSMRCDETTFVAQNDFLICSFGSRLIQNHRDNHLKSYVSQRIRQLSKFLIVLRTIVPKLRHLKDFLTPKYFRSVVEAAKSLSGYNKTKNTYIHPSVAVKIGHSILQCADIFESQLIIQNSTSEQIQDVKNFAIIFQKDWKFYVSSNACQDINKKKFNKPIALPDANDITLLQIYLKNQMTEGKTQVKNGSLNQNTYKTICQTLMVQIILLNRRRSGEVQRIKIQDYHNRNKSIQHEVIKKSLTDIESKLSKHFIRFEIRGKRGRGVPVLLTNDMKESLDILLSIRNSCNVFKENEFIFAIPFSIISMYRGSDCLKNAAIKCKAKSPELLTSTKLRKHIATMSQLFNLSENDKEELANFMGHDLSIHKHYYKLPDETLQISRISKILLAMESGLLHELREKTLEEFDNYMLPEDDDIDDEDVDDEYVGNEDEDKESNKEEMTCKEDKDDNNGVEEVAVAVTAEEGHLKKSKRNEQTVKKSRGDYQKWSQLEMKAVERSMNRFIKLRKIPQQHDCLLAQKNEPALVKRSWKKIKFQVANMIKKQLK